MNFIKESKIISMKKFILIHLFILCLFFKGFAQPDIQCYPTNWWVGMKNPKVQVMLHGKNVANVNGYTINYPGVKIQKVNKVENANYVFLDLIISAAATPGIVKIKIVGSNLLTINFELKARRAGNGIDFAKGVTSKDFIYLIMPDRFSNGDTTNESGVPPHPTRACDNTMWPE